MDDLNQHTVSLRDISIEKSHELKVQRSGRPANSFDQVAVDALSSRLSTEGMFISYHIRVFPNIYLGEGEGGVDVCVSVRDGCAVERYDHTCVITVFLQPRNGGSISRLVIGLRDYGGHSQGTTGDDFPMKYK